MTSFEGSEIILWIIVFVLVAAIPLTLLYFAYLNKKNSESHLSKLKSKKVQHRPAPPQPVAADVNFNFNNNWSNDGSAYTVTENANNDKKMAKIILKTIALNGESGMLIKQIADTLELHALEINYPLEYLSKKGFIESVVSQKGNIFYLTPQGAAYCSKKGYMAEVA